MPNPPHQAGNPEVVELDATAPIEAIVNIIRRDGGIIIKNFLSPEIIDRIHAEAQPYWSKLGTYVGKLFDAADPPLSGFAGKSPTFAHQAINHPTFRETAKALLKEESNVYRDGKRYHTVSYPVLAVSEAFNRGSPSTAQQLHRDDMAQHFEHLEGSGESSLLGLLIAGVDTNFDNGATQVIVGSHKWPEASIRGPADRSLCSTCEMQKGDAVFIIGSIWHGAGENRTNPPERRIIYSCHMTRGSLRADENQYLGVDLNVVRTYEPQVQALLGYSVSHPSCGHVGMKDPITLLGSKEDPFGYGEFHGQVASAVS
ncbi:PhyH-domain-containing protein [Aspergillus uvarum CBS 121591]|uniref:PhyH-domain-containing protein n=1 Tax=Aspergillus uvarum CBS 121591 TaxID=1448315 RepID=A0A319BWE2_9EURO|nr:PhyH-domain-containing protein [Aspergillus uvarum CBS 121591]PYH77014.1 PhyH-domain-containing protein [Aspergillus uvarum CBS 121591]